VRTQRRRTLGALLPLFGLGACGLFADQPGGLAQVDDLVGSIERVYVDAELAKSTVLTAVDRLRTIAAGEFTTDPVAAYHEFDEAVKRSTEQADMLRTSFAATERAGPPVFERWTADLDGFTNPQLRQRSETRLQTTRARYDAVVAAVRPALASCDAVNAELRDHVLFLGHDYNAGSIAALAGDVRTLAVRTTELTGRLDVCLAAARAYVDMAALPAVTPVATPPATPGASR
jgi:hypothetical protein